jgi:DNA polymerase I-like protein with 3'-5' exonuclease and polymerase domains
MKRRTDAVGLWWADYPVESTRSSSSATRAPRHVPPPVTGWLPPRDLPNLSAARVIGLDTETKDLALLDRGPGFVREAAHVVGVSLATEDRAWYFPLRHEYDAERDMSMDPSTVFAYLNDLLSKPVAVVGANLMYDLEALRAEGVRAPAGELFDVQYAEPLLEETARSYSLDTLARKHLGHGKETPALYQWCADSFGGEADEKQRANVWRAPPSLVGPYAEADALLPLQVLHAQRRLLADEGLTSLFRLECALIPLLLEMRFRGVRVDEVLARRTANELRAKAAEWQAKLPGVDVWSSDTIARAFSAEGLEFPLTDAGNPSFTRPFLESVDHPLARAVLGVRMYEKAVNPFIESYILGGVHKGRVHCQFHPLRSDEYGTVSGRFSSSNPNLQNIPSRDPVLGPLLRSLFVPEEGCRWRRADYSQIEYRLLAHYAVGDGAEAIRERYRNDPTTDFHEMTMHMVREHTGVELGRKPSKNLNFGLVYGMGRDKTTRSLGVSEDLGERLYDAYFVAMPSVKKTYKSAERLARRRGYIKTLLARRRRFVDADGTHRALNACLQGGAADIIKKAMVDCHKAGVFDATGIPHLTVHDELDWSDDGSPRAQEGFAEAERIMVECVKLKVPLMVDVSRGKHWGECL